MRRLRTCLAALLAWASAVSLGNPACAAGAADEAAIRTAIDQQVAAWNAGDGVAYARPFAADGSFTNLFGTLHFGHDAFEKRHVEIFATFYRGTSRQEAIERIRFVTDDVAVVDVATEIRGLAKAPAGVQLGADGVLRTRLLQVFVKREGAWWIEAYHNVDVKPPAAAAPARAPVH